MTAEQVYEAELAKLRSMRGDFSDGSNERFHAQYCAVKHAYLTMCYQEAKDKGVWR